MKTQIVKVHTAGHREHSYVAPEWREVDAHHYHPVTGFRSVNHLRAALAYLLRFRSVDPFNLAVFRKGGTYLLTHRQPAADAGAMRAGFIWGLLSAGFRSRRLPRGC